MNGKKFYLLGSLSGVLLMLVLNMAVPSFAQRLQPSNSQASDAPALGSKSSKDLPKDISEKINAIYKILDENYVYEYDYEQTVESIYSGLVYGVGDPYTSYMTAETLTKYMEETEGVYTGVGTVVSVDEKTNRVVIISPYEGYPGARAGLLPGDAIVKVDDQDIFGDALDEAVSLMRGEPGTSVKLTIYRESENRMFDVDIIREVINMPTVSHKVLDDQIGYLRITNFDRVTTQQFNDAYADLRAQNIRGLIIDLRNNPGGLVSVVCNIADTLLPRGTIVSSEDKHGRREVEKSDDRCIDIPLLILVNGNSASASEILAGAVKDLGVGELVGTQTFGKGLIQTLFPLPDGSAVKVTIARYFTPSGVCIQGEGIPVDYEVEMSDELSVQISTLTVDEDVQLKKAIEVMRGKM